MNNLNNVPEKVREELNEAIADSIENRKRENEELAKRTFCRKSPLSIETVMKLLISMHGGSLKKELLEANVAASASAFVQKRNQISWLDMEYILESFNEKHKDAKVFRGFHVYAVDGTTVNLARDPMAASYVQHAGIPDGVNQLHVTPIYDVLAKTYQHVVIQNQSRQNEVEALRFMLSWYDFPEKSLIVGDRAFQSYNIFATFIEGKKAGKPIDFLIRTKQDRTAMKEVQKLPMEELDTDISFTITTTQKRSDRESGFVFLQTQKNENRVYSSKTRAGRWDFESPYFMKLRIVRLKLDTGEYETLATSLPRSFTLADIKELYHSRWGIETAFRELKYGLGLTHLHGKKDEFVKQEILSAMIMANFTNRIVNEVVIRQNAKNAYTYKANMTMAIHLCKEFYRNPEASGEQLMKNIGKYVEPIRPGRRDERNLKTKSFEGFCWRVAA